MKKLLIVIAAMSFIACKQTKPATALVQNKNFDTIKKILSILYGPFTLTGLVALAFIKMIAY